MIDNPRKPAVRRLLCGCLTCGCACAAHSGRFEAVACSAHDSGPTKFDWKNEIRCAHLRFAVDSAKN